MEEAEDIIRQMNNFARQNSGSGVQTKITSFQGDLSRIKRDFDRAVRTGNSARDELFNTGNDDMTVRSLDQRSPLLEDRQMLQDGNDRLKNTRAISERTEQIG